MRSQSGSIFSFIAIGLVLVIATGLVVFTVNNRTASNDDVIDGVVSQADPDSSKGDDKEQAENRDEVDGDRSDKGEEASGADSDTGSTSQGEAGDAQSDESRSEDSTASPGTAQDGDDNEASSSNPTTGVMPETGVASDPSSEVSSRAQLPETGVAVDMLSSVIGIIAIIGSGYVYYHFGQRS